jgi:hypothetical protein
VRDAELVDVAFEGIGDAAHVPADAKGLRRPRRRSERQRLMWWKMMLIAERWVPRPRLRHPYPDWRFDVMTRGGSPVR